MGIGECRKMSSLDRSLFNVYVVIDANKFGCRFMLFVGLRSLRMFNIVRFRTRFERSEEHTF